MNPRSHVTTSESIVGNSYLEVNRPVDPMIVWLEGVNEGGG